MQTLFIVLENNIDCPSAEAKVISIHNFYLDAQGSVLDYINDNTNDENEVIVKKNKYEIYDRPYGWLGKCKNLTCIYSIEKFDYAGALECFKLVHPTQNVREFDEINGGLIDDNHDSIEEDDE